MSFLIIMSVLATIFSSSFAGETAQRVLHVYGPGGPFPAIQEAAKQFGQKNGIAVEVTSGPLEQWATQAKKDADIIYSGAEYMMTDYTFALPKVIVEDSIRPLYMRPSAILVRPGNPKRILTFEDLLRPSVKVLVVNGAGQSALWEDIAGRTGRIDWVRKLRRQIAIHAKNSAQAKSVWVNDSSLDAWITWNIWQVANPSLAEAVSLDKEFTVFRSCDIALTVKGRRSDLAKTFLKYLETSEGVNIFHRWGWF